MIIQFDVSVDVPEKDWRSWVPYVKQQLMRRVIASYKVVSVVHRENDNQKYFEEIEKQAIERGELDANL